MWPDGVRSEYDVEPCWEDIGVPGMNSVRERFGVRLLRWFGPLWCVALSVAIAYGVLVVRHRLWAACEPPGNSGASDAIYMKYLMFPATVLVAPVVTSAAYWWVLRRAGRWAYTAPAIALLAAVAVGYLAVVMDYDPSQMTEIWCAGGQPDWWPRWLPL